MKIEKLVIYGFGKHENASIELGPGMNVLYGHNEAGKTTIQQFILHVLFGFPPRNSTLLRYEPKSGGKYGGQIHLNDAIYGKCIVERVRGKSVGDVKVYFENGEVGEQEALQQLLRQYDRVAFESIFSFSLLQLQGFEKMNEQELSRTLLASGTTGVDHFLQVEATMDKEMNGLFKKSGRNPALNKKLTKLRKIEALLQEEVKKADQYAPAVQQLAEVEEELTTIYMEKAAYEEELRIRGMEKQQLPLQRQRAQLKEQLLPLEAVRFPVDGIQRYESIVRQLDETKAVTLTIQQELQQVDHSLQETASLEQQSKLEQFIERESDWHRSLSMLASLKTEHAELMNKEHQLRVRLGVSEEIDFLTADVSLRQEETLYELLRNLQHFHREVELIERKKIEIEEEIERIEAYAEQFTAPSEEDIEQAKTWPKIRQQIAEAKAYVMVHAQQQDQFKIIVLSLFILTVAIAGYGVISKQYGLLFIAVLIAVAAFTVNKRQATGTRIKEMESILAMYAGQEARMEKIVERVYLYSEEQESSKQHRLNIEIEQQQLSETYSKTMQKIERAEQSLESFLQQYGIDGLPSANIIPELFRMIRDIQEVMRRLEQTENKVQQLAKDIAEQQQEAEQLLQQSIPKEALYEWIRQAYKRMTNEAQQIQTALEKKQRLEKEEKEKIMLMRLFQEQIVRLFTEATVKTEEAYYKAYQMQEEKFRIQQQLRQLATQLIGQSSIDLSLTDERIENMMEEIKEQITALTKREKHLVEEKAILVNKTTALLSDESASELKQQFEIERAQFIALAKKWASKKALASAIQQMMNDLKEKKFPSVLKEATQLFKLLTNEQYSAMVLTEEGYFEVVTQQGLRFPIAELSQATKEQAYISLRLALARSIQKTAPFPIIMDDPFVHFDEQRLSNMRKIMDRLTTHQFIYFTCQKDMKDHWQQAKTINVSTIGNKRGANI